MKWLIWGTGDYCKEKIQYNFKRAEDEVLCFVDREKGIFQNKPVILPSEISKYQYDRIAVMSSHFLEIIREMIAMGIPSEKIIPGIMFRPLYGNEFQIMTDNSKICVLSDGQLDYSIGSQHIRVSEVSDWEKAKALICAGGNAEKVKDMEINPVGRLFGLDRGGAIDRYYIGQFLQNNSQYIYGNVLEMGENTYTNMYGDAGCVSYVFKYGNNCGLNGTDLYGDLQNHEGLPQEYFDCIIFTQVFNFIFDIFSAVKNSINMLKPGGVMLVSVAGNTPVSRYDMDRWGHYWNFTDKSVKSLFRQDNVECTVCAYGNCKTACAFLQGMSYKELEKEELDYNDSDFQIVITALVKKIGR